MKKENLKIGPQMKLLVDFLADGNVEKFARDYSIKAQNIRNYIKYDRGIYMETLNELCRKTGANKDWLLTGEGEMMNKNDGSFVMEPPAGYGSAYMVSELMDLLKSKDKQIENLLEQLKACNESKVK